MTDTATRLATQLGPSPTLAAFNRLCASHAGKWSDRTELFYSHNIDGDEGYIFPDRSVLTANGAAEAPRLETYEPSKAPYHVPVYVNYTARRPRRISRQRLTPLYGGLVMVQTGRGSVVMDIGG